MKPKLVHIFLLLFTLSCAGVQAQHRKLQNRPYADHRVFHLGFALGLHTQDMLLTQSGAESADGEVWFSEIPHYSVGFNAGIIADAYLNRYINLRFVPTLYLGDKNFVFKEQASGEEFQTRVRNNYIALPLHLKVATQRINNYRPYVLAGGYAHIELGSRKGGPILLKPMDYGIEIGFGCDFYLPMFKLAPEIKFSFGFADLLEKNRTDLANEEWTKYPQSLSKATQRMVTLNFNFE